jgi:uncharacterized repeat protein (TIGR03803 family)
MDSLGLSRYALTIGAAVALLAGCGGSQPASTLPIQPMSQLQNRAHSTGNGYKLLYSFQGGTDGEHPSGGLTSLNGVLYGLTSIGGGSGYGGGTVFSIGSSGQENVLYRFQGGNDGANPTGGLLLVNGSLYGTTQNGGSTYGYCYGGCGTVFKVSTSGEEQVLYEFQGGNDGYFPSGDLTALHGVLYGTTSSGGGSGCGGHGCGTVFSVTTAGTETVLYRFKGGTDGATPNGQLLALRNVLYGTTYSGGRCVIQAGCGTVFKVTTSGHEAVLYRFKGAPYYDPSKDGGNPAAGLLALNGTLYGTTAFGGVGPGQKWGTVFEVSTSGMEHVLHRFNGNDGKIPYSKLIAVNGLLYGTTTGGGPGYCDGSDGYHCGVIFRMNTAGKEHVLYDFLGNYSVGDGGYPIAGLTLLNGSLYGVTIYGGQSRCYGWRIPGCGTVFKISP